ncbi:extracellular solute-binding protein [Kitasatospora arboriphila]
MPGTRRRTTGSPAVAGSGRRTAPSPGGAAEPRRRRRLLRAAAALGCAALALTACSSGPVAAPQSESPFGETITLKVGTFGSFGYREAGLYADYMAKHPEVVITEAATQDSEEYWADLTAGLTGQGGKPLADIQAVEVGYISEATGPLADKLTDLQAAPGVHASSWLPWKSAQATTASGALVGLGTDTGPMAVCYRKDLFQKAGLPSDREAVGGCGRATGRSSWTSAAATRRTHRRGPRSPTRPAACSTPCCRASPSSSRTPAASWSTRTAPG